MKRTRPKAKQIIRNLKTAEQLIALGNTVAGLRCVIEVTQMYHRWRQPCGGTQAEEARRLTHPQKAMLWRQASAKRKDSGAGLS
ncbi:MULTISPECIES: hypothetical protein [Aphanothece]|uniref:hypothetical protein n=1 Tax=Aphanothece TaxID=1121 RepID=UPI003984E14E